MWMSLAFSLRARTRIRFTSLTAGASSPEAAEMSMFSTSSSTETSMPVTPETSSSRSSTWREPALNAFSIPSTTSEGWLRTCWIWQPVRRRRSSRSSTSKGSQTAMVSTSPLIESGRIRCSTQVSLSRRSRAEGSGVTRERSIGGRLEERPTASSRAAGESTSEEIRFSSRFPPRSLACDQSSTVASPASIRSLRILPETRTIRRP